VCLFMRNCVIIGGGPAGLAAGIYLSRAKVDTVLFEKNVIGGQVLWTDKIENYPGFIDGVDGYTLINNMKLQAERFGLEIKMEGVNTLEKLSGGEGFIVATGKQRAETRAIIYSAGAVPQKMGIPGENEFTGHGVSYCATCDGAFNKGKDVLVVGGGDSALEEALFLTRFAQKVTIIHRRDKFRGTGILQEHVFKNTKIKVIWDTVPVEIKGDKKVESMVIKNVKTQEVNQVAAAAVFVFVGTLPQSELVRDLVDRDERGYVITNNDMSSRTQGLYVCGDVRSKLLKQIATACGEAATAASAVTKYLDEHKW